MLRVRLANRLLDVRLISAARVPELKGLWRPLLATPRPLGLRTKPCLNQSPDCLRP